MTNEMLVTAEDIDRMADEGVDLTPYIVEGSIERPNLDETIKKLSCAFPNWVVKEAELEARHLGVSRSAVINMWMAEKAREHVDKRLGY